MIDVTENFLNSLVLAKHKALYYYEEKKEYKEYFRRTFTFDDIEYLRDNFRVWLDHSWYFFQENYPDEPAFEGSTWDEMLRTDSYQELLDRAYELVYPENY